MILAALVLAAVPYAVDFCPSTLPAPPPPAARTCRRRVAKLCAMCAKYPGAWVCEALRTGPRDLDVCAQPPALACTARPTQPDECPPEP